MPEPLWQPGRQRMAASNMARFMNRVRDEADPRVVDYASLHAWSLREPETFWRMVWDFCGVRGTPGDRVLDNSDAMPGARWFPGAQLNFADNLLARDDDHPALVFRAETGERREISYRDLRRSVERVSAALAETGVEAGDRVAGYLPNLPETVIAMLAAARLGAAWTSCSPDFGVNGVVDRLGQVEPRVLFCAAAYHYNGKRHECLDRVAEIAGRIPSLERIVVVPHDDPEPDLSALPDAVPFADFAAEPEPQPAPLFPFDHPLYILYSSGTTGVPKCIVHGAGGTLLQHLKELVLHTDLGRQDRFCYFTTCGWMMWNWMASGLAVGATVVLYEGSPFHPGPEAMFDLVDGEGITVFGTGAKAIAAWEKAGILPRDSHRLDSLRTLLSTGSPLAPASFDWVYRAVKGDLCLASISGGTDIVSCFALGCPIKPVWRGELQCLGLGMDVQVRRDDGSEADVGETGELCCAAPFPAMPVGFWGDDDGSRYRAAYFDKIPDIWAHGDYARITEHGGMVIYGRSDATLNPGGVRIGTAEIYRQVEALEPVLEALAVGQDWDDDQRVLLFVCLRDGLRLDDELRDTIRRVIRANTSPRHVPARIVQVADIPRTVSGKITELAVRDVIHGRAVKNVDALANPEALDLYRDLPELQD